ncbi:DNA damage-binding protein 1a [Lunasporangiospora selenospora]|uniref:DNA damage-binding protein 1a n=1 Tax=Lunasporangiospora selenospora TaxID=979761 RepID=A0A9P6KG51_9FUNG|nr:DNA damage-binding protein 1a [Lunasporangiospora selenospora]
MNIVFTARKSSAVFQSIKGNFTGPDDQNLILGKGTRVEVYLINSDGLKLVKEFGIYGEIACLMSFRPMGHSTDMLLLTTTHYQLLTLSLRLTLSDESPMGSLDGSVPAFTIISDSLIDIQDRHARPSDTGQIVVVDPTSSIICCRLYQGLLKCVTVNMHSMIGQQPPTVRPGSSNNNSHSLRNSVKTTDKTFLDTFVLPIEELNIISIAFLHGCTRPTLAVLYQDNKEVRHIKTYEFNLKTKEKSETGWIQSGLSGAGLCIPVPTPIGGLLVVGEYSISYFNPAQRSAPRSITFPATIMRCYDRVDDDGTRYLLGDHTGMLYVLVLILDGAPSSSTQPSQSVQVVDLKLECLGAISIPEAIVYLDKRYVFVGSHQGDSQLIQLHTEPDQQGEYLEVLESFTNIAPITDFEVVDLEGQGQGQIVACSGSFKNGSLRIVRNGVGINDRAFLSQPGITDIWSLKEDLDSPVEDTLVMSFLNSTRVVRVTPDTEMIQEEVDGFVSDSTTLICGNVKAKLILQVTPSCVRLVAPAGHIQAGLVSEWRPPTGQAISLASMNGTQCVIAIGGKTLVYLDVGSETVKEVSRASFENEIACIDVSSVDPTNRHTSQVCAVGFWTDIKVALLRLPSLEILTSHALEGEILPRSLLLSRFENVPYLLAGLGDGQLLAFVLDSSLSSLANPKCITLGTQPIMLRQISSTHGAGSSGHVFACSDQPTVIYSSNRKLLYSNVNLKQVTAVTSFNCEAFPDALAIVNSDEGSNLRIGTIDEFQELHVQSIPVHESARRIAYMASKKCFGILSMQIINTAPETVGGTNILSTEEEEIGFIRLHDDQTFDLLHTFEMSKDETPHCITAVTFAGDPTSYFAVGTMETPPEEDVPKKGRILILEVSEGMQLKLVSELEVKGGVLSIKEFNGKLLCGINDRLNLYSWKSMNNSRDFSLVAECTHRGFILILSLAVYGDFIVVGDFMRSMTLLRYIAGTDESNGTTNSRIEEIARDTTMDMLMTVEAIDDETFIAANNSNCIFTLVKDTETTSEDEAKRLKWSGGWHVGDQINRFKHGSLVSSNQESDAPAVPKLLFGTVSGAIGVIATLSQEKYIILHQLETNMSKVIKGIGGLDHASWRRFRTEARKLPTTNFVDGDLVELFLDLSQDEINDVMEGVDGGSQITIPVTEVTRMVEELSRLH